MAEKVLVVAAHPDDETFGCGATLLKYRKNGVRLYWLIATEMSEAGGWSASSVRRRDAEIGRVARAYGFEKVFRCGFPAARIDETPMPLLVERLRSFIAAVKPSVCFLPFAHDVHSDHRKVFEAAFSCVKTFRQPSVRKVMMMEALSETEFSSGVAGTGFVPNCFVDVSGCLERKIAIMKIYKGEYAAHPFPRSAANVKALAMHRGATAGCRYAEAFMTVKEIC